MSDFLQRLEACLEQRWLFSHRQKILVAVSGGADSMALLHGLNSLANTNRVKLFVAHFNHRLRGRASDADERLVRQIAGKLRLNYFSGGAEVKTFAAKSRISVEMAARKLRHEFLARTAREQRIPVVALAHHADDQVELFFLRLLRGAGGEGLAGMKWCSPSPADKKILLVRPLLDFSKAELLAFVRENKIRFRDDATNFSTDMLRNRLRNELLPLLRNRYQLAVDKTVLRLMEIVGAEAELARELARRWNGGDAPTAFDELPLAVQRKVLQQQLGGLGLLPDFELVEHLRCSPGNPVSISAGLSAVRDAAGKIHCQEHSASQFNAAERNLNLSGRAGRAEFGGRKFHWKKSAAKDVELKSEIGNRKSEMKREFFDADKIGGEIVLRHWRPGDRFQPIGLRSAVKLQDLFVNAKIPAARRRELVLATTAGGEIFWVEGMRIGEKFKLTPRTGSVFVWKRSKIAG